MILGRTRGEIHMTEHEKYLTKSLTRVIELLEKVCDEILKQGKTINKLNTEIEEKVIKSVRNAMSQKTLIMVTHKLEILKYCDKIISIEKNKIKTFNSYKTIKKLIKKSKIRI